MALFPARQEALEIQAYLVAQVDQAVLQGREPHLVLSPQDCRTLLAGLYSPKYQDALALPALLFQGYPVLRERQFDRELRCVLNLASRSGQYFQVRLVRSESPLSTDAE